MHHFCNHRSKVVAGTDLYFSVEAEGDDLWKSDGTIQGTKKIKDHLGMSEMVAVNNKVYFVVTENYSPAKRALYVSDGTAAGTHKVNGLNGDSSSDPSGLMAFGDKLVFTAVEKDHGREVWITDGTDEGTQMLKDIFAGEGGSIYNHQIAILGDHFYFAADDGVHGMELWRFDGTPQNTMIVKDLVPGPDHAKPERLVSLDDKLYFRAFTPAYGCELWVIDASSENYSLLTDVIPGPEYANPQSFTKLGDNLVFFADTPANGVQLWAYNEQVTGVEHTTESLVIFPNPSSGRFYVNLGSETLKDAHVEVLDLQGKAVYVNDNSFLETGIDLQPYPPGIYIVRVKFGSKNFVWKVVKV